MGLIFSDTLTDIISLLAILLTVLYIYIQNAYKYWDRISGVKTLPPTFPFGNYAPIFKQQLSFGDHLKQIYDNTTDPIIGTYLGITPIMLVRDASLVYNIFVKDFQYFYDRGMYTNVEKEPLTGHLFSLPGEKWKNLRAKLSPTFTSGKIRSMFSTLVDCGDSLIKYMDKAADRSDTLEMRETLAQYTTNIIASVAFGIEIDCIGNAEDSFRVIGRKVFEPSIRNSFVGACTFMCPSVLKLLSIQTLDAEVSKFMTDIVTQNLNHREENKVSRKDFFQLLVQLRNTNSIQVDGLWDTKITTDENKKFMSIYEVAAQSFVFFVAGFETSSSTMSFLLYELARNPECQRKVQNELEEVLKKYNGQVTFEAVAEMKYLDLCVDETLRLYPPLPLINRECTQDWPIPNTNSVIKKGTLVFIPALALQKDSKFYPEPEKFIPERFSPENCQHKTFAEMPYMPFGEGPRICIGLRFGKIQTKTGLMLLLNKYQFDLAGNTKEPLKMNPKSFVIAPTGGIQLKVTHRQK